MNCQRCNSEKVLSLQAWARDCHTWEYLGEEGEGYAPVVPGVCAGDETNIDVCLDCGQLQWNFPSEFKWVGKR